MDLHKHLYAASLLPRAQECKQAAAQVSINIALWPLPTSPFTKLYLRAYRKGGGNEVPNGVFMS